MRTEPFQSGEVEAGVQVGPECVMPCLQVFGVVILWEEKWEAQGVEAGHRGEAWLSVFLCAGLLTCLPDFLPSPLPSFRKYLMIQMMWQSPCMASEFEC